MILAVLLLMGIYANGQSAFPALGGDVTNGNGSLSYTVGQLETQSATTRVANAERVSASIHEGVQQTYSIEELKIDGVAGLDFEVTLYPNPTADNVTIRTANTAESLRYELFSIEGKRLQEGTLAGEEHTVEMKDYPSGSYLLRISVAGRENNYRIVKIK